MDIHHITTVLAQAAALPPTNENGMRISLPGVLSLAQRALKEMALPLEHAPEHIHEQFDERVFDVQPDLHAFGLEELGRHLALLKTAVTNSDALTVRKFFDLYVFD